MNLRFIAGVEISITWAGKTVHIVGLGIDENNAALREGLDSVRGGRERRGREISAQLESVGIPGAYEGALKFADNPEMLGRTHFARFLVEAGVQPTVSDVFANYLVEGKPGFVPHRWTTLQEAVRAEIDRRMAVIPDVTPALIRDAGHMLHHDQPEQVAALIEDFLS